jgi:NifU-like protein involved in Fe-S cluster formation
LSELDETGLLKLAARASGAGRLDNPDGTASVRNPFCGDRLTMDVRLSDGKVAEVGYDIRACLVCQASASILGAAHVGNDAEEIDRIGAEVQAFLSGDGAPPDHYEIFEKLKPHKNRHICVDMPFQAVREAVAAAIDAG